MHFKLQVVIIICQLLLVYPTIMYIIEAAAAVQEVYSISTTTITIKQQQL
jgi:hypothetical protein